MNRRELDEQLEACRADSHDLSRDELREAADHLLHDEELAARFEKQQRQDSQISQAMQEIEAPSGLAERILAQLAEDSGADAATSESDIAAALSLADDFDPANTESPTLPAAEPSTVAVPRGTPWPTVAKLAAMATAACLLVAVGIVSGWFGSSSEISQTDLEQQALDWASQAMTGDWKRDQDGYQALERQYPLDEMVGGGSPTLPYRVLDSDSGIARRVAAFDYSHRGRSAYLFVAKTEKRTQTMPTSGRAAKATPMTKGWNVAAWHDGEKLYVVMFKGDPSDLRYFVDSVGQIAMVDIRTRIAG